MRWPPSSPAASGTGGPWAAVVEASGTATSEQLAEAVQISLAQFAPGSGDQQAAG